MNFSDISMTSCCLLNCIICSEKSLYQFQCIQFTIFWTAIVNEWTALVELCCHGKNSSYILHLKWLGLAVMGTYHLKLWLLWNLELYLKCKYIYFDSLCQLFKKKEIIIR